MNIVLEVIIAKKNDVIFKMPMRNIRCNLINYIHYIYYISHTLSTMPLNPSLFSLRGVKNSYKKLRTHY